MKQDFDDENEFILLVVLTLVTLMAVCASVGYTQDRGYPEWQRKIHIESCYEYLDRLHADNYYLWGKYWYIPTYSYPRVMRPYFADYVSFGGCQVTMMGVFDLPAGSSVIFADGFEHKDELGNWSSIK
jgi:hypothetical protein